MGDQNDVPAGGSPDEVDDSVRDRVREEVWRAMNDEAFVRRVAESIARNKDLLERLRREGD